VIFLFGNQYPFTLFDATARRHCEHLKGARPAWRQAGNPELHASLLRPE
jgi:hypothetical protein